jgi:arylsulfatase A-like enzyme
MGYGDLVSFGNMNQEYNHIDMLAAEGLRFRNFYVGDSLCTPSRVCLNTGRLAQRSGMVGGNRVVTYNEGAGLPASELTIAEALRELGYHTGMVGKWHLGINAFNRTDGTHLPHNHGFEFVGTILPYSNVWECDETYQFYADGPSTSNCFIYWRDKMVQQPIKLNELTRRLLLDWYTFFNTWLANKQTTGADRPFYFYYAFPNVHTAFWHSSILRQFSKRGLFGDSLNEMAWAVEHVIDTLKGAGEDRNTLVLFLSDHGPHREICTFGGETAGLKGGKSNFWEGAFRIPGIAWMPGTVPAGQLSDVVMTTLDLLPTFISIATGPGQVNPIDITNITHDGIDVSEYILG